ncbi:hypothetical protein A0U40_06375 [[Bacillus] sp. KCTC 13219]|nr:hypothetical protein A0U40_06375 [[Bacillus] sp. KCTC 13219]
MSEKSILFCHRIEISVFIASLLLKDNTAKANVHPIFKRGVFYLYESTFCEASSLLSKMPAMHGFLDSPTLPLLFKNAHVK